MANLLSRMSERVSQLRVAFANTARIDRRLVPYMALAGVAALLVWILIGVFLLGRPVLGTLLGIPFALMAAMLVFGRRAMSAQFQMIRGQPGAAAAVLQSMRGRWIVTPAVAFSRKQDFVHRVVGRPGVIVVGEGAPARTAALLRQEGRKAARVVGDTPVHEVMVGDREGQVPLPKLQRHLMKLPRRVRPRDFEDLTNRLKAVGGTSMPIPKGPLPRMPRGKNR